MMSLLTGMLWEEQGDIIKDIEKVNKRLDHIEKVLMYVVNRESIVHCKECEYWQDNNGGYPHPDCRWGHDETPDADDFCSFGERMKKDGDAH